MWADGGHIVNVDVDFNAQNAVKMWVSQVVYDCSDVDEDAAFRMISRFEMMFQRLILIHDSIQDSTILRCSDDVTLDGFQSFKIMNDAAHLHPFHPKILISSFRIVFLGLK